MQVFTLRSRLAIIFVTNGALLFSCQLARGQASQRAMPKVPAAAAKPVPEPPAATAAQTGGQGTGFEKVYASVKEKSSDAAATLVATQLAGGQSLTLIGDPAEDKAAQDRKAVMLNETDIALALQLIGMPDSSRRAAVDAIAKLATDRKAADKLVADCNTSGRLGTVDDHSDAANAARGRLAGELNEVFNSTSGDLGSIDALRAMVHVPTYRENDSEKRGPAPFNHDFEAAKKISTAAAADLLALQALRGEKAAHPDLTKPMTGDEPELTIGGALNGAAGYEEQIYAAQVVSDLQKLKSAGRGAEAEMLLNGLTGNNKDAIEKFRNSEFEGLRGMILSNADTVTTDTDIRPAE